MPTFRVRGTHEYNCSNGHQFRACAMYEYAAKTTVFEVVELEHKWVPTGERPARTYLPVCPTCEEAQSFEANQVVATGRAAHHVQVSDEEAAAFAINPKTGEEIYCFQRPDAPMPEVYRQEGFVKVQLKSFKDLQQHCRERGMVNDIEGDWHQEGEGFFEEDYAKREKKSKEFEERYMEEREKIRRGLGLK